MNRVEIKEKAKKLNKGNIWVVLKPFLVYLAIGIVLSLPLTHFFLDPESLDLNLTGSLLSLLIEILIIPILFGIALYMLNFVRGKKVDLSQLFKVYKKFIPIFVIIFLVGLFCALWSLLLIIPGIIAALSYAMVYFIFADDNSKKPMQVLRESKEMMYGYKWNYFVFELSFLGWYILGVLTFGLLLIYVVPYHATACTLYYEGLRKKVKA